MVSLIVKNIIEEDFGCEGRPDKVLLQKRDPAFAGS